MSSFFGNSMQHLELARKRQIWWAGLFIQSMTSMLKGEVPARFFFYQLHTCISLVLFESGFSFINCLLAYHLFSSNSTHGTHHPHGISTIWNSLDYSFLHNCEELSSNSEKCVFLIPLTSYEDPTRNCMRFFTSNVLQNCAELQKLREAHLPPVEFHRTQLRKVRDFTCSALQNCEELKEFWKFASSSLWISTSPNSQM